MKDVVIIQVKIVDRKLSFVSVIPSMSGFESKEFKISSSVSKLFNKLLVLQWKINKLGPAFLVSSFKLLMKYVVEVSDSRSTLFCHC